MKRKKIAILGLCVLMTIGSIGCKKESNSNQKESKNPVQTQTATEDSSNSGGLTEVKKTNVSVTIDSKVNISSSDIPIEEGIPVDYQKIDDQIQAELDSNKYTLDNPFIILDPYHNSPLTALILFNTEEEYKVRITVQGDKKEDNVSGEIDAKKAHRVPVIGLYPNRKNKVTIELLNKENKTVQTKQVEIQTDPLPTSMKDVVKVEKKTKPSAYGLIEVSGQATPHAFAYDTSGVVRWYLSMSNGSYGMFPISGGKFMFQADGILIPTEEKPHTMEMYEMDYLGRIYQVYYVQKGIHHEIIEKTPGGNILILSSSIDGHVEDVVQELDRETGAVVKTLDMREIFGDTYVDMIDWAHLNTASYNEADNSLVLSPRNVHSGIKIDWETNELKWILCDPRFWEGTPFEDKVLKPKGDIKWHYQPHTIYQLSEDLDNNPDTIHVMLFDNHWHKTRKVDFFDDDPYSYVSLYTINEKKKTVQQDHLYKGAKSKITSNFRFDSKAKRVFSMGGYLDPEIDGRKGMIYEYDYDTEKVLNQYSLRYTFYRAYEFEPDYNVCAAKMDIGDTYIKGSLLAPKKNEKALSIPKQNIEQEVSFRIQDVVLYMKAGDHTVSQVEFIGEKQNYIYDLTFAGKGAPKYKKLTYEIAIPLSGLKEGSYQIVVTYNGKRFNTNKTVSIKAD